MDSADTHLLVAKEWAALVGAWPEEVRQGASRLARENNVALATYFYDVMLEDKIASAFLTHEQVRSNLHASMKDWVIRIVDVSPKEDLLELVKEQINVGVVHARVAIPVHVVLRGARALKRAYSGFLGQAHYINVEDKVGVFAFLCLSIDFAMEIMAGAYAGSHDRSARAEESYRLFSMAQDVTAEKESRRAALLDWENNLIYEHALDSERTRLPLMGDSDFGLWFKHKGAHIFHGSFETSIILDAMNKLDTSVLPALVHAGAQANTAVVREQLREVHAQTRLIATNLERLFDQRNELEAGRDALTRLLSRRFLDVILAKEVAYARRTASTFALLAIDIDHFKQVNDTHGHDSGDMVLQQFALLLSEHTRGGDYVFRIGGEEFLVVLVDIKGDGALRVAEKLRARTAKEVFRVRDQVEIKITVSMGLALHDGHPDHSRLLRRADDALYRAKNSGRNSIVVAEGGGKAA